MYLRFELAQVGRFDNVGVRCPCHEVVPIVGIARIYYNKKRVFRVNYPPESLYPVHPRHLDIENHKVKVFVSAEINALNSRGDMTYDPVKAAGILDYVSVAISHHREHLNPDYVEDTLEMIDVVSRIPEVTMLMHPQIVYGHKLKHVDAAIPLEAYDEVFSKVVQRGKAIDYPSVEMSMGYLKRLGYPDEKLMIAQESFENFTTALVRQGARLAPGSDGHNVFYRDRPGRWFGNNRASWDLLQAHGFDASRLWYFENR